MVDDKAEYMSMFTIKSQMISEGLALGTVLHFTPVCEVENKKSIAKDQRKIEIEALKSAIESSRKELETTVQDIEQTLGKDKAEIFACHLDILMDEDFQQEMFTLIQDEGYVAPYAAKVVSEKNALEMEELEDPLFAARAADFRDIGQRLISFLSCNGNDEGIFPPEPAVIVAPFLTPGQTIRFNKENLRGIIISKGGKNSHAAILARSVGIPAVVVPENMLSLLRDGMSVVLNFTRDAVIVNPDADTITQIETLLHNQEKRNRDLLNLQGMPAVTLDGHRVKLYANGGSIHDVSAITQAQPDGIGLFRTEFLFMEQNSLPDEEVQASCYRQVLQSVSDKPVVFRLLDIGGDKPLPYMPMDAEKNPFLGVRGIRFLLANPEILHTQIRSMLLASVASGLPVRIMVPMVSSVTEMEQVSAIVQEERSSVGGTAVLGMMVETPAAALSVAAYKDLIAFISIGSNDLTQYTLAVDRESEKLSMLYNEFHPSVLKLMQKAVCDAHACGIETGICGEFASKPEGAVLLAGIGFDELSMSPRSIAQVKHIIRNTSITELQELVHTTLEYGKPELVYGAVASFLETKGLQ
ncbi:MAG: phosphoenolpyruvate--protein phosphotransferase [Treponema sp.]|nr:phosphoenolpyruvate--protein phosphotransferase [Treponema sp.]